MKYLWILITFEAKSIYKKNNLFLNYRLSLIDVNTKDTSILASTTTFL